MKLIGKIKQTNTNLDKQTFHIIQALLISKYEYERIYKDFIDNQYALIVDDSMKETDIKGIINDLQLENDVHDPINIKELNYKLSTDFFLFYYFTPNELKDYSNLNDEKVRKFIDLVRHLRIDIGYITNEIFKLINY